MTRAYALFETAIGACGIAWGPRGVTGLQLPEQDLARTGERMRWRFAGVRPAEPDGPILTAMAAIISLLNGHRTDLSFIELDMDGVPSFDKRVYQLARLVPPGALVTYGDIANRLGAASSARAVGQALGRNPFAIVVPCHRVVAADGRLGGFSATGGGQTKLRMLAIEGVHIETPPLFS
jgi:methylated-DNA-[protein]-cysteine S-methyltransferase